MVLLFVLLLARAPLPSAIDDTAGGILKHLSLLFVPAGVGVVQQLPLIGDEGIRLLVIILLSTIIALAEQIRYRTLPLVTAAARA